MVGRYFFNSSAWSNFKQIGSFVENAGDGFVVHESRVNKIARKRKRGVNGQTDGERYEERK
jgi:hypothetical protein